MEKTKDRISTLQTTLLVVSSLVGVGILTLPRTLTEGVGVSGLLNLGFAGITTIIAAVILSKLSQRFQNKNVVEYSQLILGKVPGMLLSLFLAAYFILATSLITRQFTDVIKVFLLRNTPLEVVMIAFLLCVMYLVQHGIQPLARINEAFFPILLVALGLLLIFPVSEFSFDVFKPIFSENMLHVLKLLPAALFSFIGIDIIFFVAPYMEKPKKLVTASVIGIIITIAIYSSVAIVSVGAFGIDATQYVMYPTLTLARYVSFPGAFLERFDALFVAFWIIAVYGTVAVYYYMAGFTITRTLGLRNFKPIMYALLPIMYITAILPQNITQLSTWTNYLSYIGAGVMLLLPGLLYVTAVIRKEGKDVI